MSRESRRTEEELAWLPAESCALAAATKSDEKIVHAAILMMDVCCPKRMSGMCSRSDRYERGKMKEGTNVVCVEERREDGEQDADEQGVADEQPLFRNHHLQ